MRVPAVSASELLRRAGLKRTAVRLAVIQTLEAAKGPLGVQDLAAGLPESTDSATVYRTLQAFVRTGIIYRVRDGSTSWLYALGTSGGDARQDRLQFACRACGSVEFLDGVRVPPELRGMVKAKSGCVIEHYEVVLHGVCERCIRNGALRPIEAP